MPTQTSALPAVPHESAQPAELAGLPTAVELPVASLTVYRALAACHVAGAVLSVVSIGGAASSVLEPLRLPLTGLAIAQLVGGIVLLRRPTWIPALLLRWPRLTWATSVGLTLLVGGAAVSYAAYPFALSAACWVSTAAAVGPRRGWPLLGVALSVGCLGLWTLFGRWDQTITSESAAVGAVQLAAVFLNAAWMGAAGNAAARRLRRWGLIVAADDGTLERLRQAGADVRDAAHRVLERTRDARTAIEADAARQVGATAAGAAPDPSAQALLGALVDGLRVPFAVKLHCDAAVTLTHEQWAAARPALLRQLGNVVRHAGAATEVILEASVTEHGTVIAVEDDGGRPAPSRETEGGGSQYSRDAIGGVGGVLRYLDGAAGVRLELSLPPAPRERTEPPRLGLGAEVRAFADLALRNNRLVSWLAPVPALIWAFDAPWTSIAALLIAGAACERTIWAMGPSDPGRGPFLPLLFVGAIAVALAAVFSFTGSSTSVYPVAAATSYPIIEVAWRHRWGLWALLEVARGMVVLPWVLGAGAGSIVAAYAFPLAVTVIVLGAERLVRRGDELDRRVGGALVWRRLALESARDAALRHDVVERLLGAPADPELAGRLAALDAATQRLAKVQISLSDPVGDSLAAVRASLEPVPLHVVGPVGTADATAERFAAFGLLQRLDRLEAVSEATVDFFEANPPRWHGGRRLMSADARVELGSGQGPRLTLVPRPSGDAVEIAL